MVSHFFRLELLFAREGYRSSPTVYMEKWDCEQQLPQHYTGKEEGRQGRQERWKVERERNGDRTSGKDLKLKESWKKKKRKFEAGEEKGGSGTQK